jgi:hypothetical protein
MMERKGKSVKIPILTNEEVVKLAAAIHTKQGSEEKEEAFWEEVYEKRGLHPKQNLINEFYSMISLGNLHINFRKGASIESLSDDGKIKMIQFIRDLEKGED